MKSLIALISALLIAGCAAYDGRGLGLGVSSHAEVVRLMGEPALRFVEPDGSQVLVYPRGPAGFQTYMLRIDASGILTRRENVLDQKHFARLQSGMTQDAVLRIIGPPWPDWTMYFAARDELVWEWRWCDDFNEPARFNALFDGHSGKLRSTLNLAERLSMPFGQGDRRSWCGH
ncbi:MAG: hypothetical protein CVU16_11860 [Betaproteobacteria bacterium HGW-Betaproteobacteria-10]|nr:MAG: hypothetical protein CVU16_11860 [Betaproteobacteria bacterium HGW-Betaproteobacteria-10]